MSTPPPSFDTCSGCEHGRARRAFLRDAAGCLAATFVALGFSSADAATLAWTDTTAEVQGADRRYPVPAADGVNVDKGSQVILVRFKGQVFALALACPHQQAAVRWEPNNGRFACSKHDSKYDPTGVHVSGRATRNMDRFPIRRDGDAVVVDAAHVYRSDQDAAAWAAAVVAV